MLGFTEDQYMLHQGAEEGRRADQQLTTLAERAVNRDAVAEA
jgi:hypothetical protein